MKNRGPIQTSGELLFRTLLTALLTAMIWSQLWAGGPLRPTGNGAFIRWNPDVPVAYAVDPGPLSPSINNAAGLQLVNEAFGRWEAVATTRIRTSLVGSLPTDVDVTNFNPFLSQVQPASTVIFDLDGMITDCVFGQGQSNSILGFASPAASMGGLFVYGFAVLNGTAADDPDFNQTITHELGHLLGLDHSQANRLRPAAFLPIMFPFAFNGQSDQPQLDDRVWISFLYPTADFATVSGTIRGRTRRRSGAPFQGAFVNAVRLEPGGVESQTDSVGVVSDFLMEGKGEYLLPGLPEGDYHLFVEPIRAGFTGGSSVGPFEERFTDFPRDFFNGAAESGQDDNFEVTSISVKTGQVTDGIDVIVNNDPPETRADLLNTLGDDSAVLFEFPTGFSFPYYGRVFHNAFVHSDGNLTFLISDTSTSARNGGRLVAFIRIAPLFTDLDPSAGGLVRASSLPGQLRIEWVKVPEFGGVGDNTFSVTLFSNGAIQFQYDEINLTPDDANDLATVGISPGFFSPMPTTAQVLDLSSFPAEIPVGEIAILEELGPPFDLTGRTLTFQPASSQLLFPFYRGDATFFTGFAATNFSSNDSAAVLEARTVGGAVAGFPVNPGVQRLESNAQFARVGSELFGLTPTDVQEGWVRMTSSQADVSGFFQFGNGVSGPLTQLDGGTAVFDQSTKLFFTRILQGPVFPSAAGLLNADTTISLANPNDEPIQVELRFFLPTGFQAFPTVMRDIPSFGVLREGISSLFDNAVISEGHLQAVVTQGPGAVGFELINLPDSIFGLNAVGQGLSEVIYSAQLANGGGNGVFSFTSLNLVNTSDSARQVVVRAIDQDGNVISTFSNLVLNPGQSLQRDSSGLFGIGLPSTASLTTGSIIVEADAPGIIGDILFGDAVSAANTAALALQADVFQEAIFSQVANGTTDPGDPTKDAFTGLALFNPGTETAQVTISVFNSRGVLQGETTRSLMAGTRFSQLVDELVPESANLLGGYIRVSSTGGIVAQQLFGNAGTTFLSAVPPRVIQ